MNYAEYKKNSSHRIVEAVTDIIKHEKLNTGLRAHYASHQRFYLMAYLRVNTNLTLKDIGNLFAGRSHATVLNAIEKHENFESYNDSIYRLNTQGVREYLEEEFKSIK